MLAAPISLFKGLHALAHLAFLLGMLRLIFDEPTLRLLSPTWLVLLPMAWALRRLYLALTEGDARFKFGGVDAPAPRFARVSVVLAGFFTACTLAGAWLWMQRQTQCEADCLFAVLMPGFGSLALLGALGLERAYRSELWS